MTETTDLRQTISRETRARRKIREAAMVCGWTVNADEMIWTPIGAAGEKEGRSGGWEVWVRDKYGEYRAAVLGYSWEEVAEEIERLEHDG